MYLEQLKLTTPNILVIEDNIDTAQNIKLYMQHNKFHCDVVHSGAKGVVQFQQNQYHLVILDWMLPDLNGVAVCRQIREVSQVPVIMLTAKVSDNDLVEGLEAGADEYVKKPYSNKELVARVKAHLRRHGTTGQDDKQVIGSFTLSRSNCTISINQQPLTLTKTEYVIMQSLLEAPEKVFSREQLFNIAFGDSHESIDRTIDVHLHNLRKKIRQAGLKDHGIQSVYGLGYKWLIV